MTSLLANTEENRAAIIVWYHMQLRIYCTRQKNGSNARPSIIYLYGNSEEAIQKNVWPDSKYYYSIEVNPK